MDMFYGGKRGYSFILRPNLDDDNGYWESYNAIHVAAQAGKLKYGEYAIVTTNTSNGNMGAEHGNIYRIQERQTPVLVGRIGNPIPVVPIEISDGQGTESYAIIDFLNERDSKAATGVIGRWKNIEDNNGNITAIGLSFDFPQPVIELTKKRTNNLKNGKNGLSILKQNPYYYKIDMVDSPNIYIGTESECSLINNSLDDGDIWLQIFDGNESYSSYSPLRTYSLKKPSYTITGKSGETMGSGYPLLSQSTNSIQRACLLVENLNLTISGASAFAGFSCELQLTSGRPDNFMYLFDSIKIGYKQNNSSNEITTSILALGSDKIYSLNDIFTGIDLTQGLILTRISVSYSKDPNASTDAYITSVFNNTENTNRNLSSFSLTLYTLSSGGV